MATAKERWDLAKRLATKLGVTKGQAYNGLPILEEHQLVNRILNDDEDALHEASRLRWYGKEPANDSFSESVSHVQIMLWAIRKIGDLNRAKSAFRKACNVLEVE